MLTSVLRELVKETKNSKFILDSTLFLIFKKLNLSLFTFFQYNISKFVLLINALKSLFSISFKINIAFHK